jgi:transcriptional regulator with XRE-family HTH domain
MDRKRRRGVPRHNPPRSLAGEEYLAERVSYERDIRGWSYEALAKRMTDAGVPMNQSAIQKIEKGNPRRRITVDELLGFAKVFGTNVSDLLLNKSIGEDAHAAKLFQRWQKAEGEVEEARLRAEIAHRAFEKHTGLYPDVMERITQAASERPVRPGG